VLVFRGAQLLALRRTDQQIWHVVAGRVEIGEGPAEAAIRELQEETGLDVSTLIDLDLVQRHPPDADVLEQYLPGITEVLVHSYAIEAPPRWEPLLNEEHDDYRWCSLGEAMALLRWPEARAALTALAARHFEQRPR